MTARSRATAARSPRSRTQARKRSGPAGGVRDAINEVVNALQLGNLARRLTSAESAVTRLEREVRRLADVVQRRAAPKKTTTRKTSARRVAGARKASPARKTATRKTATRKTRKTATRKTAARKTATRKKTATRTTAARTSRKSAAESSARRSAPIDIETPTERVLDDADETASQEMSTITSPLGPGPLPLPGQY